MMHMNRTETVHKNYVEAYHLTDLIGLLATFGVMVIKVTVISSSSPNRATT